MTALYVLLIFKTQTHQKQVMKLKYKRLRVTTFATLNMMCYLLLAQINHSNSNLKHQLERLNNSKKPNFMIKNGQPVDCICSGVKVENGVVYKDGYNLMLFEGDCANAVIQTDVSGQICGSNGKLIFLCDGSTMKLYDAK